MAIAIFGISRADTIDNVRDMSFMFYCCSSLTSLDVSGFKTDNVTDMRYMFYGCSKLSTIYAGDKWSTKNVQEGGGMFNWCEKLVGGSGTLYDFNHIDYTYAHIDGGASNPGYLTSVNDKVSGINVIYSDNNNAVWYDIKGNRLENAPTWKGVYIRNGKKVIKY